MRRVNPEAEGKVYPEVAFVVATDRARMFADLFADPTDVPPTFPTAAEFSAIPAIVADPDLDLDFTRVVHGSQEYEYRRPLVPGERLTARTRLASIRRRAGQSFLTIETELVGSDHAVAVVGRSMLIERGADV